MVTGRHFGPFVLWSSSPFKCCLWLFGNFYSLQYHLIGGIMFTFYLPTMLSKGRRHHHCASHTYNSAEFSCCAVHPTICSVSLSFL